VTGHSHFQTSSIFSAKVGKMAEAQLVTSVVLQELLKEWVQPRCESDDELEYIATLLLETERTTATRITGYLENVVPNLSAVSQEISYLFAFIQIWPYFSCLWSIIYI